MSEEPTTELLPLNETMQGKQHNDSELLYSCEWNFIQNLYAKFHIKDNTCFIELEAIVLYLFLHHIDVNCLLVLYVVDKKKSGNNFGWCIFI